MLQENTHSPAPLPLGGELTDLPLPPLYRSLRNLPVERVASLLPSLSREERQLLLDIDLWEKDSLDIQSFEFWLRAYAQCEDDKVVVDFSRSISFQLYLKSCFNIYTFDGEDPWYPDHDNYFLTEDNLFLFEYHENYSYVAEMKSFILNLYSRFGVEEAYTFLFKTVSEHFSSFQECEYEDKKRRLSEHGFVDYYEALEFESCWPSFETMDAALVGSQADDADELLFSSHTDLLQWQDYGGLSEDFDKVRGEGRRNYLKWDFVRLTNAVLVFDRVLKSSDHEAWEKTGVRIRALLSLGRSYVRERFPDEDVLCERFDFSLFYKVGNTLVRMGRKRIKGIRECFGEDESFMGTFWSQFLSDSLGNPCSFEGKPVWDMETWWQWQSWCDGLFRLVPFMESLYKTWKKLLDEGHIQSSFYLNYTTEEIDFDTILISSFANHHLATLSRPSLRKMGLTMEEHRRFIGKVMDGEGKIKDMDESIHSFFSHYGLEKVPHVQEYFWSRLRTHLEGVDYDSLEEKDYKHLGGPVIFAH